LQESGYWGEYFSTPTDNRNHRANRKGKMKYGERKKKKKKKKRRENNRRGTVSLWKRKRQLLS